MQRKGAAIHARENATTDVGDTEARNGRADVIQAPEKATTGGGGTGAQRE